MPRTFRYRALQSVSYAARDPFEASVLKRIKVAADAAARTLGTLFAIGTVLVVVLVGCVTRIAVVAAAAATTVGTTIITIVVTVIAVGTTTTRTIIIITIVTIGTTIIAIVVTVIAIGTTTTRTIIAIVIAVIVTIGTTTTRTIIIITIVTIGTTVITTATAAATVIAIGTLTARSGGFLIFEAWNGQGDLAAIVNALHDYLNGVAFLEHVFDGVDTLAVGQITDLGDVQQAVGARGQVHEGTEGGGLHNLAVVGFAGFRNVRVGDLVDDLLGLFSAVATFGGKPLEVLGESGAKAPILYGGSVKPGNAKDILAVKEVNGALVGGASLKADDFLPIVRAV